MALINPVHGLVVPFLCIFTIPLAILAGITSALAFSVLIFRVAVVYLDIALALVPQYFKGKSKPALYPPDKRRYSRRDEWKTPSSPPVSTGSYSGYGTQSPTAPFPQATGLLGSGYISPHRRKSSYGFGYALNRKSHQSSSQVSLGSVGTISPIHEDEVSNDITPAVPASEVPAPSVGLDRDFEGVGGWRLDDGKDDCDEWIKINSRLELPLEWSSFSRHSQRSQSVGPMTHGEGSWLMMRNSFGKESFVVDEFPRETRERRFSMGATKGSSPNSSRLRMNQIQPPTFTTLDSENYFFHADRSMPKSPKKTSFV